MRTVLITSEPVFQVGFRTLIESSVDLELVGQAEDARSGFKLIDVHKPDVLVMDVFLNGMNGINATREVRRRSPGTRVLLVADWGREKDALQAFAAGAHGLALKTEASDELLGAVRRVGQGRPYVAPAFRRFRVLEAAGLSETRVPVCNGDVLTGLSAREREVLDLIVRGWRNPAIAQELCISVKTVDTHRTRIHRKLGCTSASELIRFAADNDLLPRPPATRQPGPGRTIVLMVDDDPQVRGQIARDLFGEGCRHVRADDVAAALADLRTNQTASWFVIDGAEAGTAQPNPADIYRELLSDDPALARTPVLAVFENGPRKPAIRAAASLPHVTRDDDLVKPLDNGAPIHPVTSGRRNAHAV